MLCAIFFPNYYSFFFLIEGIMSMPALAVQALALIMRHLKQFGFERILCLGASFRPFSSKMEMTLSANALQQLEVRDILLTISVSPTFS